MKTFSILFIAAFLLHISHVFCQAPVVSWQHCYGGSLSDEGTDLQKTSDGGLILCGFAASSNGDVPGSQGGSANYWIIKLDAARNIQWKKTYGGSFIDEAYSIRQTTDGGYIVAGQTQSADGNVSGFQGISDFWILKLNANGNIEWKRTLGGSNVDVARCVQQTNDGGYIVAGETFSSDGDVTFNHGSGDYWVIKMDAAGNILWKKTYGGSEYDYANYIEQTTDGGYVIAGASGSMDQDVTGHHGFEGEFDYWIIKIDAFGNLIWQSSLGGTWAEEAKCVRQVKDGGFLVAGNAESNNGDVSGLHGSSDYWVVKLNPNGIINWQHTYGGSGNDRALNLEPARNGNYIVTGFSGSTNGDVTGAHGGNDFWILKISGDGQKLWEKACGGSSNDWARATRQMPDGSFYTTGKTYSFDGDATGNHGTYDMLLLNLGSDSPSPTVAVSAVSTPKPCWSQPWSVDYITTGTFNPGNIFTAQLSDVNGAFVNPTNVGSVTAVNSGTIPSTIPAELKPSSYYKVRVVGSDPPVIGGAYPTNISLWCKKAKSLKSPTITSSSATVTWTAATCHQSFVVLWKPTSGSTWDTLEVTSPTAVLTGLFPATMYDWKVKMLCSAPDLFSDFAKSSFTTTPLKSSDDLLTQSVGSLEIYPNPATDLLNIKSENSSNGILTITNLMGETVETTSFNASEFSVDISSLKSGAYLLMLKTAEGIITKKFVKE